MNTKKELSLIIIAIAAVAVTLLIISGAKNNQKSPEVVTIGGVFALTGDSAPFGEMEQKGALLAIKEINEQGGIKGKRLQLVSEDMQSKAQASVSALSKLVNVDKVRFVVGPTWMDSYPGGQGIVKDKEVMLLLPSSSMAVVGQEYADNNIVSLWYRTDEMARQLVASMKNEGVKSIVIIQQNDAYYLDFSNSIIKYAKESGIELVADEEFNPGNIDFRTTITKYKDKADGVVFGMYDKKMLDNFLKNKQAIAPNMKLYSNSDAADYLNDPQNIPLLEGMEIVMPNDLDSDFSASFKKEYNIESPSTYGSVTAYDAVYIIAELIKKSDDYEKQVALLRSSTFNTKTYGPISFNEIGAVNSKKGYSHVVKVEGGKMVEK